MDDVNETVWPELPQDRELLREYRKEIKQVVATWIAKTDRFCEPYKQADQQFGLVPITPLSFDGLRGSKAFAEAVILANDILEQPEKFAKPDESDSPSPWPKRASRGSTRTESGTGKPRPKFSPPKYPRQSSVFSVNDLPLPEELFFLDHSIERFFPAKELALHRDLLFRVRQHAEILARHSVLTAMIYAAVADLIALAQDVQYRFELALDGKVEANSNENPDSVPRSPQARPAYGRDHWFLARKNDGSKDAEIRDAWDAMSDQERAKICPKTPGKVITESKRHGTDTVKKGIATAKKELGEN